MNKSNQSNSQMTQEYTLATDENPSTGVWSVVSVMENCSPLDLPPLAEATDPDALDSLLVTDSGTEQLSFQYCGYEVTATSDTVHVQPLGE